MGGEGFLIVGGEGNNFLLDNCYQVLNSFTNIFVLPTINMKKGILKHRKSSKVFILFKENALSKENAINIHKMITILSLF